MKLNRRERISLISLLAALAALAMDKLLLSETPQAAEAGLYNGASAAPSASQDAAPGSGGSPEATADVPRAPATAPDVFSWTRIPHAAPAARPTLDDAGPSDVSVETFRATHTLRATLLGPRPMALIGDQTYRIGETLDGFVLESISESEVAFVSDSQRVVLRVAPAWQGNTP